MYILTKNMSTICQYCCHTTSYTYIETRWPCVLHICDNITVISVSLPYQLQQLKIFMTRYRMVENVQGLPVKIVQINITFKQNTRCLRMFLSSLCKNC